MKIDIRRDRDFTYEFDNLKHKYGSTLTRLNGFEEEQLNYTDFIDNFIDTKVVADASIDGNSNVSKKDIVTLLNEMPLTCLRYIPADGIMPNVLGSGYCFSISGTTLIASSLVNPPLDCIYISENAILDT